MGRFLGQSQGRQVEPGFETVADVTANRTLEPNSIYYVNTAASVVTLTLPQLPLAGNFVDIIDVNGTFHTNNCIVNPSGDGSTVGGFSDNLTLNLNRVNIRVQYSAGTNNWAVTQLV